MSTEHTALSIAPVESDTPVVTLIREATEKGASPEYLSQLLAARKEWDAQEARKQYYLAISEFQRRVPIIPKADQGEKSPYAKMDRIWRTIRPLMGELGLSVAWYVTVAQPNGLCHVEGQLAHRAGHFQPIAFDVPIPDVIRTKEGRAVTNVAQQMGSAHTYAQRYGTCSALGVITGDDDDGRMAGSIFIAPDQAQEIAKLVDACAGLPDWDSAKFWKWADATLPAEIKAERFDGVIGFLKRKLSGGAK